MSNTKSTPATSTKATANKVVKTKEATAKATKVAKTVTPEPATPVLEKRIIKVTQKEKKVIDHLIDALYAEPHFTDVDCKDLATSTKMSVDTVKGIVGSLVKKQIFCTVETETAGCPKWEGVLLDTRAFNLHTNESWKDESEAETILEVIAEGKAKPKATTSKSLKDVEGVEPIKKAASKAKAKIVVEPAVTKPYGKYGMHGSNIEIDGFKKGDKVSFEIKSQTVIGEYVHFHKNNWSKNGYAVIKYNGKIYERVLEKFTKVVAKKAPKKVAAPKVAEEATVAPKKTTSVKKVVKKVAAKA